MVDEEIGARLSLKDRRQFSDDAQKASKDVKNIGDEADKVDKKSRKMAGGLGIASKGMGGLTRASKLGIVALGGVAAAGAFGSIKFIQLGMDAAETQSKFNTVFQGMGGETAKWVKQMNSDFGIPTKELQDAAATFGVFGKAAGVPSKNLEKFSTDLTGAGMDLASFYNADQNDVFLALKSGLAGEAEPLRAFGIFLSDATMKAEALSMGLGKGKVDADALSTAQTKLSIAQAKHNAAIKKYGANSVNAAQAGLALKSAQAGLTKVTSGATVELTEAQKVAVRQRIIMKSLGDAQGDLKRTSGGLANQWRGLKGRLTEAGTAIGTAVLPYVTGLVNVLNDHLQPAVKWIQGKLPGYVHSGMNAFADFASTLENLWNANGFSGFSSMMDDTVGAGGRLEWVLNKIHDVGQSLWTILNDSLVPSVTDLGTAAAGVAAGGLFGLDGILKFASDHTTTLHVAIVGITAGFVAWKVAVATHTAVMAISGTLMAARVGLTMLLTGATGLNTAAEMTRNQALVAGIALQVRMGIQMAVNAARAVVSTAITVGAVVGGWILMGATAMASGLMMAAAWIIGLGPIGWAIGLLILVGAAFVVLWQKSETFRNIVTGAFHAVLGAASGAFNWIKGNWPLLLAIITGPVGLAVLAVTKNFDKIKEVVKGAVNYLIDAWNGLEFKIPSVDTHIPGVGKIGGFSLGTPDIPRLHSGGTTTTGGAVNMKPGEEIVVLPPAAQVIPDHDGVSKLAAAALGRGSNGPTVLQVVLDRKVVAEAVYDEVADKMARS